MDREPDPVGRAMGMTFLSVGALVFLVGGVQQLVVGQSVGAALIAFGLLAGALVAYKAFR